MVVTKQICMRTLLVSRATRHSADVFNESKTQRVVANAICKREYDSRLVIGFFWSFFLDFLLDYTLNLCYSILSILRFGLSMFCIIFSAFIPLARSRYTVQLKHWFKHYHALSHSHTHQCMHILFHFFFRFAFPVVKLLWSIISFITLMTIVSGDEGLVT